MSLFAGLFCVVLTSTAYSYSLQVEKDFYFLVSTSLADAFSGSSQEDFQNICQCLLNYFEGQGIPEHRVIAIMDAGRRGFKSQDQELRDLMGQGLQACFDRSMDEGLSQASLETPTSAEMNCTLQLTSEYVSDSYAMYDYAYSEQQCLDKCRQYAKESVEVMADSVERLAWKCNYEKQMIHNEIIK